MTEYQLFNCSIPNESNERFEKRKELFNPKIYALTDVIFFNTLFTAAKKNYPIHDFLYLEICDDCSGNGCECCDSGEIYHFFNSVPNEPNVIGMMDRMVND